jgi:hypothetical protein
MPLASGTRQLPSAPASATSSPQHRDAINQEETTVTEDLISRRSFLSAAAVASAAPALTSDRIAVFDPPPGRVRIVTAAGSPAVAPPMYTPAEIRQIESQGKDVKTTVPADLDEASRLLADADVVFGAINAEMLARAKNLRWLQATEAGVERVLFPGRSRRLTARDGGVDEARRLSWIPRDPGRAEAL